MNAHSKSLLLLARHFWVIKYWQTTPNKTREVSHRAPLKTEKASDSFVWAGFIVSWFMTSPALTSHYTWIDFTCASRHITQSIPLSVKSTQRSSLKGECHFFRVCLKISCFGLYRFKCKWAEYSPPPISRRGRCIYVSLHCISTAINSH